MNAGMPPAVEAVMAAPLRSPDRGFDPRSPHDLAAVSYWLSYAIRRARERGTHIGRIADQWEESGQDIGRLADLLVRTDEARIDDLFGRVTT